MRIYLTNKQRAALAIVAIMIVIVQFAQFTDRGFRGNGWVFSFVTAAILLVIALAKNTIAGGKADVQVEANSRDNAAILTAEIERRADDLAKLLIAEHDIRNKGLIVTAHGSEELGEKFLDGVNMHISECCIYLMFGLVAIRRSKGNQKYVQGAEFRALQNMVRKKQVNSLVNRLSDLPAEVEIIPDNILISVSTDLQSVCASIIKYCVSSQSGEDAPESALLAWFQSRCGVSAREKPQVAQALFQQRA